MSNNLNNPISYSSRDFQSIINDINTDSELSTKPNWWKRLWAGIGDTLSTWLNAIANNLYLRTAITRGSVMDLCNLIDYTLSPQTTSSGVCLFFIRTDLGTGVFPFTVAIADLVAKSTGGLNSSSKQYEARNSETFTLITGTFTANATTDNLTIAVDLLYTGHKLRFTTTGILPAPLQINTDYYVIYLNATTIKLATSLDNAFAGNYIDITSTGSPTHTFNVFSYAVSMFQQETIANAVIIGTSDGITSWQEFNLSDQLVLPDTLIITINSINWSIQDTLVNSTNLSTDFKLIPKSNNQFSVRFGNGTYGMIPGTFDIIADYAVGGGVLSNLPITNRIVNYSGGNTNITGVTNPIAFSGGADQEAINNAKILAPLLLKARDRFITVLDGESLVLNYGGISLCNVIANAYGLLSCEVVGIANGGGNPSNSLKTAIQTYLIDRTILESIDVRFVDATITSIAVTSAAKMKPGYLFANVLPYFTLAYQLFLSEAGTQIQTQFNSTGIADTITLINSIFSTTFGVADYNAITKLIQNLVPRNFGDTIENEDQVAAYVGAFVDGIAYITVSIFGSGFPVTFADDAISTPGVLTLTEI